MVEQLSPALSAFWATLFLMFILVTQRPLFALFRRTGDVGAAAKQGFSDLFSGLVTGARNMIGIAIATATAGIIVGTVTLTGIGLAMTELVEVLSGGNLMIMLILVAVICLVLGMGLPTTANYIVVSTLMAPVIVDLGAQGGLLVPLIAVHMFVFYFGIMATSPHRSRSPPSPRRRSPRRAGSRSACARCRSPSPASSCPTWRCMRPS